MTYYKQFAEMLGLELEQEFSLVTHNGEKANANTYKIKEDGFYYKNKQGEYWLAEPSTTVNKLINGYFKAVPKPWKPKFGEQYWSYSLKINRTCCNMFGEFIEDYAIWKSGNCFKTEEEAAAKGKEIMEQIEKEFRES